MKARFRILPILAILIVASFLFAVQLPGHAAALASPLPGPISPLPHPDSGPDDPLPANAEGNRFVLMPYGAVQAANLALIFQTRQIGVGWWDACGKLHVELSINGYAKIPAGAQEISIPRDALGHFDLEGWKKTMRPDGEWVLRRTTGTCTCTNGVPICQ